MKLPLLMNKNICVSLFGIAVFLVAFPVASKEYVVKVKNNPQKYNLSSLAYDSQNSFKVMDTADDLNLIKVDGVDDEQIATQKLSKYFDAEYVVENVKMHAFIDDSDPRRSEQWALDMVKANEAWGLSFGKSSVVVAVIDTGIGLNHEDLKANLWVNTKEIPNNNIDDDNNGYIDDINGWDFHGKDKDPTDETGPRNPGHGTHCAGIIGADCGNELGVCGISPSVSLMALRFLGKDGSGDLFASTKAVEYAVNNGAHIISASWGANIPESTAKPIIEAIAKAEEKGVIFVAAAANDGKSNDKANVYPANAQTPHMISVAASNSSDAKPTWSNYGRKVDIAAPGADILSTIPGGYQKLSGTSMATPMVSGIVALMKSIDINLTGAQARSILQSTGADVNIETASNKRVDAHKALQAVANKELTVVPAAKTFKVNDEFSFSAFGGVAPYKFKSLNPDIASIDENGRLVAKAKGDAVIELSDAAGNFAKTVSIRVGEGSGGGGGGGGEACPMQDPFMCSIMCLINPQLPWCGEGGGGLPELPLP